MQELTLVFLSRKLVNYDPTLIVNAIQHKPFTCVNTFCKTTQRFASNCLYVGMCSDLPTEFPYDIQISLICVEDVPAPNRIKESKNINCMLFPKDVDSDEILTELEYIFSKTQDIYELIRNLFETFNNGRGMKEILRQGYRYFKNPIFVVDNGYKLVEATEEDEIKCKYFRNLLELKYMNVDFFMAINREGVYDQLLSSNRPVTLPKDSFFNYECLGSRIFYKAQRTGDLLILLQDERQIDEYDIEAAICLRDIIAQEMHKSYFNVDRRNMSYEYFISDLLENNMLNPGLIKERCAYLNLHFQKYLYLLSADFSHSTIAIKLERFIKFVETTVSGSKAAIYNDQIVVIFSRPEPDGLSEKELHLLREISNKLDVYISISNCFTDISLLPEYYRQTMKTIELAVRLKNQPSVLFYSDFALYHITDAFLHQWDASIYAHPSVGTLYEYDKNNNTEFAETLYMYLLNERNSGATAEAMHIHRNTLQYRLKLINDIIPNTWDTTEKRLYMIHSFEMYKFKNKSI